ncbi:MAG: hypothetical protein WCK35_22095, partial [Chloroflexota bacterium]
MNILHAHYAPEEPGLFFWTETSGNTAPTPTRGRIARNPKPKPHPYSAPPDFQGENHTITLNLPSVRGIPLPSPQLIHAWDIETDDPVLAPFTISGIIIP